MQKATLPMEVWNSSKVRNYCSYRATRKDMGDKPQIRSILGSETGDFLKRKNKEAGITHHLLTL